MTIEQKAKAYDEALKVLHKYDGAHIMFTQDLKEEMFPELKESDDERIRKELLEHCKNQAKPYIQAGNKCPQIQSWIAWLERQKPCEEDEKIRKGISIYLDWLDGRKDCAPRGEYSIRDMVVWLEKQKPVKVEPKFKIGDWITNGHCKCQITFIDSRYWYSKTCVLGNVIDIDKTFHLWTIQDARDGDVLVGKIVGDDYILIFKQIKDGWVETYGHYYDAVDRFCVPSQLFCRDYQGTFIPATKEQRELLFQKMHEAGYEWDSEKKELKKIEQNVQLTEFEDAIKDMMDDYSDAIDGNNATIEEIKEHAAYLQSLIHQKPAWSEEDEMFVHGLIRGLAAKRDIHGHTTFSSDCIDITKTINWLKSLKDRCAWKIEDN